MKIACAIACIGGAHIDRHGVLKGPLIPGTSNPGNVTTDFGGVARNVAENLARLGRIVSMVSRVGGDENGTAVVAHLNSLGVDTSLVSVAARPTASYRHPGTQRRTRARARRYGSLRRDRARGARCAAGCGAVARARALVCGHESPGGNHRVAARSGGWDSGRGGCDLGRKSAQAAWRVAAISILFANLAQAASVADVESIPDAAQAARALHALGARAGIVTAGAAGIAVWIGDDVRTLAALPAVPRDVTGAGDALIAGTLFGLTEPRSLFDAAPLGLAAAAITVESGSTTAAHLTAELLFAVVSRRT